MELSDDLLQDIGLFLTKIDELRHSDRKELLITMLRKHLVITKSELVLTKYDFDMMISAAKQNFSTQAVPQSIGNKAIDQSEARNLLIIEGAITVLNNKGALNRLPKFDRR
jgi:hypothetical protein